MRKKEQKKRNVNQRGERRVEEEVMEVGKTRRRNRKARKELGLYG